MSVLISLKSFSQQVIPLYTTVPNALPSNITEKTIYVNGNKLRIANVVQPTLTAYFPDKPNGTAIIICPGGGYGRLAIDHEGYDVAKQFAQWGITAFVLKYRLPNDTIMQQKEIGPLQDAQKAILTVKENAAQWNIDTTKVGIMGFSAGGHLASTAATHFNIHTLEEKHRFGSRPAFQILIYPVISFTDSLTHLGSRTNLIGANPSTEKIQLFSNELQVSANTPPAFIMHAADDKTVKVQNSIDYYSALIKNKILSELHIYPKGGHGFGMNNPTTTDQWMDRLHNWLLAGGFLQ